MDDLVEKFVPQMPGGKGEDLDPSEVDPEVLKKGIKVEMEHTTDPMLALEISLDHISEDPLYYDKLETIDPHDNAENPREDPSEDPSTAEPVRRKKDIPREFVTGDDIIEMMSTVAEELLGRGQEELAGEVRDLVEQITSSRS